MNRITNANLKILVSNMPAPIRSLYESGETIKVKILRSSVLKRYGDELNFRVWRGEMIDSDLDEFERGERIVSDILSYFLYGEKGQIVMRKYTGAWADYACNDWGIRFSL